MESAGPQALRRLLDAVMIVGSDLDLPAMLRRIVQAAVDLVDARYGALGVLDETRTRLAQFLTVGVDDETYRAIGPLPEGHGLLGLLILEAKPVRLPDLTEHPDSYGFPPHHPAMKSFLGVPIRSRDQVFGNLYLTDKTTAEVFTEVDEELVVGLASAAGIAIENARLHSRVQELALVEDRERIARELHDTVIQRLFATGLSLQAIVRLLSADPATAEERIQSAVDDLDVTVKHIRSAIFSLEGARPLSGDGLRQQILAVVREATPALGFDPRVLVDGPVDTGVSDDVGADLLAAVREGLSNVARHAHGTAATVEVVVDATMVAMTITDNGAGPPPTRDRPGGGRGLKNLRTRAERRGGTMTLQPGDPRGAVLDWRVPRS